MAADARGLPGRDVRRAFDVGREESRYKGAPQVSRRGFLVWVIAGHSTCDRQIFELEMVACAVWVMAMGM